MKEKIKTLIAQIFLVLAYPFFLIFLVACMAGRKDEVFSAFSQFLSLFPGKTGSFLRIGFYRLTMSHCSHDASIGFNALFSHCDTIIEKGVYIGPSCNVGKSRIGTNTLLGSGVHILSGKNQHNFDNPLVPIKEQGGTFEQISIGSNCWIGNNATVMANIGEGSIIGAGSVVTSDLPQNVIAVGNPAKIVKER